MQTNRITLLLVVALLMCSGVIFGQSHVDDSLFIAANYTKKEVMIPMRDGKSLFTAIYQPKNTTEKYPILLNRTPYSCSPYGEKNMTPRLHMYLHLAREGFIFVYQDVRGRYMSEGNFMDIRPHNPNKKSPQDVDESSDTYDTVDWLTKNVANNNGRVGVFGISYPGFYASAAIPDAHPAIKCVSPQAPVTDWFLGDDFHHNGAFFLLDGFSFYYGFGAPRPKPTTEHAAGFPFPGPDNYEFYLKTGALRNFTTRYMKDREFWGQMMQHPNLDEFWKARSIRQHLKGVKPAVLTVGGLFDAEDCYGAWHTYQAIEQQNPGADNRIVMGPWSHGGWARNSGASLGNINFGASNSAYYRQNVELPFFNYYLKDKGKLNLPEALVFETGSNTWKSYGEWPPKETQKQHLYFHANGKLSFEAPAEKEGFDEYVSDPNKPVPYTEDVHLGRTAEYMTDDQRFAARRPDVMVYQTDVLTDDITLAGPVFAQLFASTTGTDADYVVKLIDVFPDNTPNNTKNPKEVQMGGYQMLVRGEVMRGRYRKSYEKPEAFKPGKEEEVRFLLPDVSHTFQKGHRIMVQVQNSWFPLVDRNPQQFVDIYQCDDSAFIKATHRIFHNKMSASNLELSVLKQ